MISRSLTDEIASDLRSWPAVAILGPRQVGKTTVAMELIDRRGEGAVYLDLERRADRAVLENASEYLESQRSKLVVLDEVQRVPELFEALRVAIDARRRRGEENGLFLLLGSASRDLLRQSSESLAGRIAYRELTPFLPDEPTGLGVEELWLRGGFPRSALARGDRLSLAWREQFLGTYLERDLPALGVRISAETVRRFWTMAAHLQGALLNASRIASSLAVTGKTVAHYLDLGVDLLLLRRLEPWSANVGKRLVRSPKVFVRDSGLVHALLGIESREDLLAHPVAGPSWEGFVGEALIAAGGDRWRPWFYRTAAGAEIDLLLERGRRLWAFEIQRSTATPAGRGFHLATADLQVERRFLVAPPSVRPRRGAGDVEVMDLASALREVRAGR